MFYHADTNAMPASRRLHNAGLFASPAIAQPGVIMP
jgi:hypothetical protein